MPFAADRLRATLLTEAAARVFCSTTAQRHGAFQIKRFIENRHRILRQARNQGSYVYGVYKDGLKRLWPARS